MFTISVDLTELLQQTRRLQPDYRVINKALADSALYVRDTWASAVQGNLLPGMKKPVHDDQYFQSLYTGDALQFPEPFKASIISTYSGAMRVEEGYPSFDMKPGLLNGPKSRKLKDGRRMNIIPFRHMTPRGHPNEAGTGGQRVHFRSMPREIYEAVKAEGKFVDPGSARLGNQIGQRTKLAAAINVQALVRGLPGPMQSNYTWKNGMYAGMKRTGANKHVQYLTFRVVSTPHTEVKNGKVIRKGSDPNSWIHPGQPGNPLVRAVFEFCQPQVEERITAAAYVALGLTPPI